MLRVVLVAAAVVIAAAGCSRPRAIARTGPVDAAASEDRGPTERGRGSPAELRRRRPARPARRGPSRHHRARQGAAGAERASRQQDDPFFKDFFNQFFGSEGPGGSRAPSSGARPRLRGHHRQAWSRADQLSCHEGSRRDHHPALRQARVPRPDPRHRSEDGSRGRAFRARPTLADRRRRSAIPTRSGRGMGRRHRQPLRLDHTVTVGVISATGRSDVGIATTRTSSRPTPRSTRATPGGPLVNLKGEVIGDQHRHRRRRSGHRLRHPHQHGEARGRPARRQGQGRPGMAGGLAPAPLRRARPEPRALTARKGRWWVPPWPGAPPPRPASCRAT